jgi:WD40 repeat protein
MLRAGANGEPGHSLRVFCAKFVKDEENLIITGGWDKTIKIWDIRSGDVVRNICGPFVCGDSIDMHDGYILSGSYSDTNQLQLWEFSTGKFCEEIAFQTPAEK